MEPYCHNGRVVHFDVADVPVGGLHFSQYPGVDANFQFEVAVPVLLLHVGLELAHQLC